MYCNVQPYDIYGGTDLLSQPLKRPVTSAVTSLTSVFGMGTGVTLSHIDTTIDIVRMSCEPAREHQDKPV